ncbi:MAG: DUF6320 domain-containing protein [Lachnospiraceae bacterium]
MFKQKRAYWRRLDNAAKLFSATSNKRDTRVFRFYCEMQEAIIPSSLQEALNITIQKYPIFLSVMRRGFFWHYLEKSALRPVVAEEYKEPCSNLYVRDKMTLLFEVTYYQNRINFEVFHALTDGTGAMAFLRELVKNYILLTHSEDGLEDVLLSNDDLTIQDQEDDSFSKYYNSRTKKPRHKKTNAFQIRHIKKEHSQLRLTEATISVSQILKIARERKVSITVMLTTALLCAIHEEMLKSQERKPVTLMIPVNLRKFFPSESMLNFFGWIEPGYCFENEPGDFQSVLEKTSQFFKTQLTVEHMATHINELIALEKHPILKFAPLSLKNVCIQAGAKLAEKNLTAVLSNMNAVSIPEIYQPYIKRFGVYTSTPKVELCVCSFQDIMSLGFTSRFDSLNIQRNFFRILSELGIKVHMEELCYPEKQEPKYEGIQFFQLFSFLCIATVVIGVMVNAIVTPHRYWAAFVGGGVLSMWLSLAIGFFKRHNLLKNAMWQLFVVTQGCILWDVGTGWNQWSVNYVLPVVCVIILISMFTISRIQSHTAREYMIYFTMAAMYGLLLPSILLLTGIVTVKLPLVICVGVCFLVMIALVTFKRKEFFQEMNKKFHV